MKTYYVCVDCLTATLKPWNNGDGKYRCEKCAIKKWEINPLAKMKFKLRIFEPIKINNIVA